MDEPAVHLRQAASRGDLACVRQLVEEEHVAVDARARGAGPRTPLTYACAGGHVAVVQYLLERGAALQPPAEVTMDPERTTPLFFACQHGYPDVVSE